jgi:hypothetical protein
MIPESWLKERLDTTDVREITRRELMSYGLSEADFKRLFAEGPSPEWKDTWQAFIDQAVDGDELWSFKSPPETWNTFAGRSGYALVRSGHIISSIVTCKS